VTHPAPKRGPIRELWGFMASGLAGLSVLKRKPVPLPEVTPDEGALIDAERNGTPGETSNPRPTSAKR
jgi:hypothetical protein